MKNIGLCVLIVGIGLGGDTRRLITDGDRPKIRDLMAFLSAADLSALR